MPRKSTQVLTVKFVENARPPKNQNFKEHPDAALPGMCLRVYQSGAKSYILSTRVAGKLKRRKIGDATGPHAIPLAEARRLAGDAKDKAKAGHPLARYEAPAPPTDNIMTFGQIADEYIKREVPRLARGHEAESMIRKTLLPAWRRVPVTELRKRHARELTDAIVGKTPSAAYRLHETYTRVLNWALSFYDDDDIGIEVSPFANLGPPVKKTPRNRALTKSEIRALWQVWDKSGYPFGPLQQLLLLTAQRRGEVAGMRWAEIDIDQKVWRLSADQTKSDRDHIVPLSDQAVAILKSLPRFKKGDCVFTTTNGKKAVAGFSKAKVLAERYMDELVAAGDIESVAPWRVHDLRRTARTGMAELGVPEIVSERILNHAPRGLVAVYNVFEYRAEKADALQRWANRVQEIVMPPPANVVKLAEAS